LRSKLQHVENISKYDRKIEEINLGINNNELVSLLRQKAFAVFIRKRKITYVAYIYIIIFL